MPTAARLHGDSLEAASHRRQVLIPFAWLSPCKDPQVAKPMTNVHDTYSEQQAPHTIACSWLCFPSMRAGAAELDNAVKQTQAEGGRAGR